MKVHRRVLIGVLVVLLFGASMVAPSASASNAKAGVVVVHGDGTVKTACVRFTKAEISGFKLLQRSHVEFQAASFSFGHAICEIDGEGVPTSDPSTCLPSSGPTWGYYTQDKGQTAPVSSNVGSDDRTVKRGSIDYWVFGTFPQRAPAASTIGDICA